MSKLKKGTRQICVLLDEELVAELEAIKEKTGLSMSKIISLRLKGYDVTPMEAKTA